MVCVHPLDRQTFVRTDQHPLGPEVDVHRCSCGRLSRRLILNRQSVAEVERGRGHMRFQTYAMHMLNAAVAAGLLQRPARCERCGREDRIDGHHYDYSRPLEVEWLCRGCHPKADAERRAALRAAS